MLRPEAHRLRRCPGAKRPEGVTSSPLTELVNITIDDLIRVAGWKWAVEEGRRHFPEQRHTRSMVHWFNSCRFFAPYYALNRLFKFEGERDWEEAFLTLTTNHFFKGSLYANKPPFYRPFDSRKNLSVPRGVNIFGIFWKWYGANYQALHYFVLVNHASAEGGTNFICFQSWSDGTTCKKPEKIVWTRNDIKLLGSLKDSNYTLVLKKLFGVNISTRAQRTEKFVIRYLSEKDITELLFLP